MEISRGISKWKATYPNPKIQHTLSFSQISILSKLNFPSYICVSSSSLSSTPRKWRECLSSPRSLSLRTSASGSLVAEPSDADAFFAVKKKATEICSDLKGASIFIVGMNSAMKTRVGKVIADALRYYYFDSDSIVEEAAGEDSSGKSFRERDEVGFRESETEVLKQLSSMGRLVVNAGDGAVQSATNLAHLRHGISIWIDVPLDMIATEQLTATGNEQSAVANYSGSISERLASLSQLYEANKDGYATADANISLQRVAYKCTYDGFELVTAEDMALEILKEIEKLTRVKKMMQEAGRPF